MGKSQRKARQKSEFSEAEDVGARLRIVIDTRLRQPCEQSSPVNRATAFLSGCIMQVLAHRDVMPEWGQFIAVAGHVEYPGIHFPEEMDDEIERFVEESLNVLLAGTAPGETEIKAPRHTIRLFVAADYGTAWQWANSYVSPLERRIQGHVGDEQRNAIEALIANLPEEPKLRLRAVAELYSVLRATLAPALAPAVAELLRAAGSLSYSEKAALTHEVNETLEDARLWIRNPDTSFPAKLEVSRARATSHVGYLRLQDSRRQSDGTRSRLPIEKLPLESSGIELIPAPQGVDPPSQASRSR